MDIDSWAFTLEVMPTVYLEAHGGPSGGWQVYTYGPKGNIVSLGSSSAESQKDARQAAWNFCRGYIETQEDE